MADLALHQGGGGSTLLQPHILMHVQYAVYMLHMHIIIYYSQSLFSGIKIIHTQTDLVYTVKEELKL